MNPTSTLVAPPSFVPAGRFVELPGRGTTFIREAAGPRGAPTVVLLHGLSATGGLNWLWCFEPLSTRYHVIAIDHRGHGHGMRTRRFRLADCADDVAALAEVLGLTRVTAVGYSMGGPIAQLLWYRHRPLVNGLVLCATSRNFTGGRDRGVFSLMPFITAGLRSTPGVARRAVMSRILQQRMAGIPAREWVMDELQSADPAAIAEAAGAIGRFSSHEWIGEVDVPTAVVVTENDQLVPPHRQRRLAESIPNARIVPVPGDHGVCVRNPRAFVPALLTALATVTGPR
ncbi:MAG TPA: alpha/beta hydrolase [Acidimicrobiales bacterium]|nr:alpha/beta hydrolase [Acidimicrobiales bacterium]